MLRQSGDGITAFPHVPSGEDKCDTLTPWTRIEELIDKAAAGAEAQTATESQVY